MSAVRLARLQDDAWLAPHHPHLQARATAAREQARQLTGSSAPGALWDWAQGHQWYGLHREADGSWVYRDWAPHARSLALVGDFSDWAVLSEFQAAASDSGQWELRLPADTLHHGQHYRLHLTWPHGEGARLPAWGRRIHQDATTLAFTAQVWEPPAPHIWQHATPAPSPFPRIYEAHPGMAGEGQCVHSWSAFQRDMLPRIHAAGYDTLQLMAVAEHPYYGSFGYHVSSFFAPSSRFGTPEELKSLIDAAHGLGIRVLIDLVHSHAVKNEVEGLSRYDGTTWQYFHEGPRGDHPAWDSRCFDYGKNAVLHFLLSNLRYWLEEFHIDGFRFDGVTSMLYHDHGLGAAITSYDDYFSPRVDVEALTYLSLAHLLIRTGAPHAVTIAEDVSGMPGLAAPLEDGGCGFHYRLAMGLADLWFRLTDLRDEDWSMHTLWHELTNRRADERTIAYLESHDQALVGGKSYAFTLMDAAMYDAMHGGSTSSIIDRGMALHKLARLATLATSGHGYLNFMGNEWGHPEWVDFPRAGNRWSYAKARRQWSLAADASLHYIALGTFDRAMLSLIQPSWPTSPPVLIKVDESDHILAFLRGTLLFVFNFHPTSSWEHYGLTVPTPGPWQLILHSDEPRFHGTDRVPHGQTNTPLSGQLFLYLPARTAAVWQSIKS